jgi:hypothetical protein
MNVTAPAYYSAGSVRRADRYLNQRTRSGRAGENLRVRARLTGIRADPAIVPSMQGTNSGVLIAAGT